MKRKTFRGEVITNMNGSFTGSDGSLVEGQRLALLLADDKGLNIFVSKMREPDLYDLACQIQEGSIISIEVEYKIAMNGSVTYIPVRIIEEEDEDID